MAAIRSVKRGLNVYSALDMGIVNKSFDNFEKEIIRDIIKSLFPRNDNPSDYFK